MELLLELQDISPQWEVTCHFRVFAIPDPLPATGTTQLPKSCFQTPLLWTFPAGQDRRREPQGDPHLPLGLCELGTYRCWRTAGPGDRVLVGAAALGR